MKKRLLMIPIRIPFFLLTIWLLASADSIQAQCTASVVTTNVTCNGLSNGSINLSASNGVSPYSYSWSNSQTTEDLSNLVAGTYACTVTDNVGCTSTASATVTEPAVLSVSISGNTVINCITSSITVTAIPSGGTAPYTYHWSNGVTTANLQTFQPGSYQVTVTDSKDCTASAGTTITMDANVPAAWITAPPSLTCSLTDFNLAGNGSTGPNFIYTWTTFGGNIVSGATTLTPVINSPGIYTLTVVNVVNGCTSTASVTVSQDITPPFANSGPTSVLTCNNPVAVLNGNGSSIGANFSYQWITANGNITGGNNTLTPAVNEPGTYTLIVTNTTNGCTSSSTVDVVADQVSPLFSGIPDKGLPCGGGQVQLEGFLPNGGGFSHLWTGPGINTGNQDLLNPIVTLPGTYTLVVINTANGCTSSDDATVFPGPLLPSQDLSKTNVSCFGLNDGIALANPSQGQGPYAYTWTGPNGYTSNFQTITNLLAGVYTMAATDQLGCTYYGTVQISQPAKLVANAQITHVTCNGGSNGSIALTAIGGTPPYFWSGGQSTLLNLPAGVYSTTVTDANGCTTTLSVPVVEPPAVAILSSIINVPCTGGSSGGIDITVPGGIPLPFAFNWSNGVHTEDNYGLQAGPYILTITDANGCSLVSSFQVQDEGGLCGLLTGQVYLDSTLNCSYDAEPGLGNWILRAESSAGTFYGVTNGNGFYTIGVVPGDYTVAAIPPSSMWLLCTPLVTAGPVGINETLSNLDFPVHKSSLCPQLSVSISSGNLRRCFSNNLFSVSYCNLGTAPALNAYVNVSLDPLFTPLSSSIPYIDLGGGTLLFEVGDLNVGECGQFSFYAKLSCNAYIGQSFCTEAHIYPDSSCVPPNVLWSGASLQVSSQCETDSIRFRIENVGSGNMPNALDYIIVEDQVMIMSAPVQLDAGEYVIVSVPANGSTWHIEVEQEPYHPGQSKPSLTVEACTTGASFSTGYVTQFPADDEDEFVDITCKEVTGSYDPNDKQAFPKGFGNQHYIRPGTPLDYQIQFQNTGNDTAFTVRIVDTLSQWLDPASFHPGASSHPYTWDLSGRGVLSFTFDSILLPDSTVNEAASHGFVNFSIQPRVDAPLETQIFNTAEIYFDFNDPIVTNTTVHRLGENFLSVSSWQPEKVNYQVLVSPNPFSDAATLEVKGLPGFGAFQLQIFDLQGNIEMEMTSESPIFQLKNRVLSSGMHLFQIKQAGKMVGAGKLVIQH